jgi:hypothetical protein
MDSMNSTQGHQLKVAPTRNEALREIASAVIFGNLGLFIGAGLPMAIFNRKGSSIALSWSDLIRKCFKEFKIPFKKNSRVGSSYPDIASHLCKAISKKYKVEYSEAVKRLKEKIADFTSLYPSITERSRYRDFFDTLDPSWIITTNYDTVIESILTGKCISLSSTGQVFVAPRNQIPVFHLHGLRTNPDSIVITQDDYVKLFRPNEYRLQKLPLILKESFTILIGYGLGDFNVLTALDWSKNVLNRDVTQYPNNMVQLLRAGKNYNENPYYENGILIIEFFKLETMLTEICSEIISARDEHRLQVEALRRFEKKYLCPTRELHEKFLDNKKSRQKLLKFLDENKNIVINGYLEFLAQTNELAWERASKRNAFYRYDEYLEVLLDVTETLDIRTSPPALVEMISYNLNRLASYLGKDPGDAHAAFTTWKRRAPNLSYEIVREMKNISLMLQYEKLYALLDEHSKPMA